MRIQTAEATSPADASLVELKRTTHITLARVGIALEMCLVLTQSLAAVWFYRLLRGVDSFAAGELEVAGNASLAAAGDATATVQVHCVASGNLRGVRAISFGLRQIPVGRLVLRSRWMPRALGWVLIAGGVRGRA